VRNAEHPIPSCGFYVWLTNLLCFINSLSHCELTCDALTSLTDALRKYNRTLEVLTLRDNRGIRSHGYKDLVHCLGTNSTMRRLDVNPPPKYDHLVAKVQDLLTVNSSLLALRRDFKCFDFESLSEVLRTNLVEKLKELSELELHRLFSMHVLKDAEMGSIEGLDAVVSSLRYYSEMQQYAPLKRLLWVLESGPRKEAHDKRPTRKDAKAKPARVSTSRRLQGKEEEDSDDDIWDYPIA
jgi:hypothetical protein